MHMAISQGQSQLPTSSSHGNHSSHHAQTNSVPAIAQKAQSIQNAQSPPRKAAQAPQGGQQQYQSSPAGVVVPNQNIAQIIGVAG
jgi:hypothetical protein